MTKVLMIGLGGVGQRHLRNLRSILGPDTEFLAYRVRGLSQVVTTTLQVESSKSVEEEYAVKAFSNIEAALDEKPQIAVICNPSSAHVPAALACAKAGCDLFIEKPVSSSLSGLAELTEVSERSKLTVMVGYQLRYHPCFLKILELLNSGILGNILGVRAVIGEYLPNWHPYEDYRAMYASRSEQGGGVVLSQIHEFDYLYALFGAPSKLYAIGGHWSHLEIDVEDTASVLMHCTYSGRALPVQLHQDYLQDPAHRQCEIIGDRARLVADFRNLKVSLYLPGAALPTVFGFDGFDRNEMFLSEMRHFLNCVETRQKPIVDLAEGIKSLKIALAVKESIAKDILVDVNV